MQTRPLSPTPSISLHLQAIDPARNIARRYAIETSADLFGHIIVDLHWGRIGTKGQGRTLSFVEAQDAARFVRQTLNRRAGARKRIGVGYRPITSLIPCNNGITSAPSRIG